MPNYEVLIYYKYVDVADPAHEMDEQKKLCADVGITCRIIVAHEGINGTLEGTTEACNKYIEAMNAHPLFSGMRFKRSPGTGSSFPRISVKVRPEIVSARLGDHDVNPQKVTGKYVTAEELHEWIHSGQEIYIVDMRNDYEFKVGYFKNSILPKLANFREVPDILPEIEHLKNKRVITVCTSGVRCEKASGFLVTQGFKDVYQLLDGIQTYMEKYPNEDFLGKLYVFDGRITLAFNEKDPAHFVVGKCDKCGTSTDEYFDCAYIHCKGNRHFLACKDCQEPNGTAYCSEECRKVDVELQANKSELQKV